MLLSLQLVVEPLAFLQLFWFTTLTTYCNVQKATNSLLISEVKAFIANLMKNRTCCVDTTKLCQLQDQLSLLMNSPEKNFQRGSCEKLGTEQRRGEEHYHEGGKVE